MTRLLVLVAVAALAAAVAALTPPVVAAIGSAAAVLAIGLTFRRSSEVEASPPQPAPPEPDAPDAELPSWALPREWLDALPCGLLLLDGELLVTDANVAAARLLGRPRGELVGVSLIRATRDHNLVQVAREAPGVPREVDIGDGRVVLATVTQLAEPLLGASRVMALEDRTELQRAQRARSDLVANASHELRTPVTAALALAETLESGVADEERRRDFHRRLTAEVMRLSEIVEELLHLSRLESRTEEFAVEELDPRELLETAAARIEPLVKPGQSLAIECDTGTAVDGDRERVLEVLANLLDNALRVSPPAGVVTLAALGQVREVQFEVRDQGPGIISRDRSRVFERFYTGDEARSEGQNTGLGLAIARNIVTRLGGRIWVSDRTPGATLCFTLPAAAGEGGFTLPANAVIAGASEGAGAAVEGASEGASAEAPEG